MEAFTQAASAIVGALLTTVTAWFLGSWILDRLRIRFDGLEALVFAYAAGMCGLSLTVFALAAAQVLYAPVLLALFPLSAWLWRRTPGDPEDPEIKSPPPVFWLAALPYAALYLVHALAPEITSDGAGYHLALIQRYSAHNGFPAIVDNIYAYLSQGAEMLYLFAYTFGGNSAAKLVHLDLTAATVVAILAFGRRFGMQSAAWAGALLYALSPIVGRDATSTYNDCALGFFAFMTLYAAKLLIARPRAGLAALTGALAGMCFAVKYTGFPAALLAGGLILAAARPRRPRVLAAFGCGVLLLAAPWLVKSAVVVGNPVAPFFNDLFPNPAATPDWEARYKLGLRTFNGFGQGALDYLRAPLELAFDGRRLGGLIGPALLLTPLALLDWRRKTTRLLLLAGLLHMLPWFENAGARFWIPALPFWMLAAAAGLARLPARKVVLSAVVAAQAVVCWPAVVNQWAPDAWKLPSPAPWRVVIGLEPRDDYLHYWVHAYDVAEALNALPDPGRAFTFEQLPDAYIDRETQVAYQSRVGERLAEALWAAHDPNFHPKQSLVFAIPRPVSAVRLAQTETVSENWILNEMRFWDGDRRIDPDPAWVWKPSHNLWDADRLHDGSLFSRWKSWRTVEPGMSLEVDFGAPLRTTAFEIVYPIYGNHTYNLALSGRDAAGRWFDLPPFSKAEQRFHQVDEAAYRRWATAELRRAGVALLVLNTASGGWNLLAPEVEADPAAWGLEEAARTGPWRIYRIVP